MWDAAEAMPSEIYSIKGLYLRTKVSNLKFQPLKTRERANETQTNK